MKVMCIGSRLFDDVAIYLKENNIFSILTESNNEAPNLNLADKYFIVPRGMSFPMNMAIQQDVEGVVPLIGIDKPLLDIAAMKETLEGDYEISVAASNMHAIRIANDKSVTKEFFKSIGINVPESVYIKKDQFSNEEDFKGIIESEGFDYPIVLKQNEGQAGNNVLICENYKDVSTYFDDYDEALCENFVEGSEISLEVLAWRGDVLPLVPVYKGETTLVGNHPITRIRYGPAEIDSLDNETVRDMAKLIVTNLEGEGTIDLDFIYSHKDKKLYAIEINARPNGTRYLTAATCGVNTLAKLIDMVKGTFDIKKLEEEMKEYYSVEVPVGTFKGSIPPKDYSKTNYIVHGPSGYQRITVSAKDKVELINILNELNVSTK